jgi:hypothetical protein
MAISTGAAILGGAAVSGGLGLLGADKAADAAAQGSAQAIAEQRRQFDTLLGLTAPQRNVGNQALNALASAFIPGYTGMQAPGAGVNAFTVAGAGGKSGGIPSLAFGVPGLGNIGSRTKSSNRPIAENDLQRLLDTVRGNPTAYDEQGEIQALISKNRPGAQGQILNALSSNQLGYFAPQQMPALTADDLAQQFYRTPGNQFALDETLNVIGNSFAARGGAFGGNAQRALAERIPNLLMDRTFGQLNVLAGFGNQATGLAGQGAMNTGANVSNLLAQAGADRGSGIAAQYGAAGNALQGGLQNWLLLKQLGGG